MGLDVSMTILHESAVSWFERAKEPRKVLFIFDCFGLIYAKAGDSFERDGRVAPLYSYPGRTPKPEDGFIEEFFTEMFRIRPYSRADQAGKGYRVEATLDWVLERYGESVGTSVFANGLMFLGASYLMSRISEGPVSPQTPYPFRVSYFGLVAVGRIADALRDLPWETLKHFYDAEALAAEPTYKTVYENRVAVMGKEYEAYRALFLRAAEAGDCIVLRDIN